MDQPETRELILCSSKGDRAAFERLVRAHQAYAYALAVRLLANEDEAREAVQESFVRVWTNLSRFDLRATFTTWLYTIVTNHCTDRLRHRNRHRQRFVPGEQEELDRAAGDTDPESELTTQDLCRVIRLLAGDLPRAQRLVFTLRDIQDMTMGEVETVTGMSQGSIRVNLHYARRRIRELLSTRYGVKED